MGFGDRFAHETKAQLQAMLMAKKQNVEIIPVWNKSNREHTLIGSKPADVRRAAQEGVASLGWRLPWHCDADHIGLNNVDLFMDACDFFTLDVADFIGGPIDEVAIDRFVGRHQDLIGGIEIAGLRDKIRMTREKFTSIARKYLPGVAEAARIYRHIDHCKGEGNFITEVSNGRDRPAANADELLVILAGLADENVAPQTIAPKFTGRFNKGVDYVGNVAQFAREFDEDICVIHHAIEHFGLPAELKLSVHSGSDKFSLYGPMRQGAGAPRRRRAPQDRRHELARGADRPGRGRRRGDRDRQGNLRPRHARARGGNVPAVRNRHRHQSRQSALGRDGRRLERPAAGRGAASRAVVPRFQLRPAPAPARVVPVGGPKWAGATSTRSKPTRSFAAAT